MKGDSQTGRRGLVTNECVWLASVCVFTHMCELPSTGKSMYKGSGIGGNKGISIFAEHVTHSLSCSFRETMCERTELHNQKIKVKLFAKMIQNPIFRE